VPRFPWGAQRPTPQPDPAADGADAGSREAAATVVLTRPGDADVRGSTDDPGAGETDRTLPVVSWPAGPASRPWGPNPQAPTVALSAPARAEDAAPGTASGEIVSPLLSRRAAAELGMYCGAALVLVAGLAVAARGWGDWASAQRVGAQVLAAVALVAAGLFARLPWQRPMGDERRRAVSSLLTAGASVAVVASGLAADVGQAGAPAASTLHAAGAVAALLAVNLVARTPASETGLLLALAWAAWVGLTGAWVWAALLALGCAWAVLGLRVALGRRTAAAAGSALALCAAVFLATGAWAWPVRIALVAAAVAGLGQFLRGRPNPWLALGAGAASALAASVAGGVVGPAPALLVGGLATMAVSAVALRGARRVG